MKSTIKSFLRKACCAALAAAGLLFASASHADTVNVPMVLTGTNNWYHTNTYIISHAVFVMSNALLNIEAGTIIKATNSGTQGTNVGALYITQGGKINAQGNAQNPIIFTSTKDDLTLPDDMPIWGGGARGLWGGVVILGKSVINGAVDATGNAAPTKYEVYEGLTDIQINGQYVFRYGGTDDNDNSGVFRYVSLRHGGAVLATGKEINGLSLGAVGRGTTVEYVESYCFADDGFEFFGGTVNTKYLVSAFNDDDSFDTDMGYRGTNQFWFSIQAPDKRGNGMELNSQLNELTSSSSPLLTPQGTFVVYNMTVLGSGIGSTSVNGGSVSGGIALRAFASPRIYNAIFSDFNTTKGIFLDDTQAPNFVPATNCWTSGYAQINNTLWWNFSNTGLAGSAATNNTATGLGNNNLATNWFATAAFTNTIADPMFTGLSRTNVGAYLDPRPQAGSAAYSDYAAVPNDGFLTPTTYRGAFGSNDLWIASWTALSEYEILQPAGIGATVNVPMVLTGTNNWYRTNTYIISHAVFVMSNALLNIEAGTIIKATNSGTQGTNVGALYITQGGKINAQGNAQNPIIFTSTKDDLTLPDDMPIWGGGARGLWGGVVILGKSVINGAVDATGNAAPTKYEVYEGLTDIQINGQYVFRYGGTDDNDNSGVFRYVSLRHGGAVLATGKEINGLSLGAVGRGTTVEYVESYCFADDGFEFFGGTVNTKYLVSAFNDDDSFDTDMGYRGTNQFWFSIQAPDKRGNGMELNSQLNELTSSSSPLLTPQGTFVVYNMTVLGSGIGSTSVNGGSVSGGIALRAFASPRIYNAIFSDFNTTKGIFLDDTQAPNFVPATNCWTSGYAQINNTLWWNFSNTGLAGSAATNNTATGLGNNNLATNWFATAAFTNTIADPMFTGLSRTNVGAYLDPRPQAGSAAESDYATAPSGLAAANYRGAFQSGAGNWAANWTALSEYGIMGGPGFDPGTSTGSVVVTPNQPVLIAAKSGSNLEVVYATQTGFSYQLQSKTNLVTQIAWDDVGSPTAGTGGNVTNAVSAITGEKFFRVKVQ